MEGRQAAKSLNPYCIGSSNHATMKETLLYGCKIVLILIVLDHLIMPVEIRKSNLVNHRLNPYCIGSSNHAMSNYPAGAQYDSGLNPYCIGSSNHANYYPSLITPQISLNPYCIGSSNHAIWFIEMKGK